jgi:hypothetical protein
MNQPQTPRALLRALVTKRRATLARLRRVNEALSRWDEINAAAEMPEELRPPPVQQPTVSWASLKDLQGMLGQRLAVTGHGAPAGVRHAVVEPG